MPSLFFSRPGLLGKVILQYGRCGFGINGTFALLPPLALCGKTHFRLNRTEALINKCHWQMKAALELVREAAAALRHVVLCTVHTQSEANYEQLWLPLVDELGDDGKARVVVFSRYGGERPCIAQQ